MELVWSGGLPDVMQLNKDDVQKYQKYETLCAKR